MPQVAAPSLWTRAHLPFTVGSVALVTLGAFENRATATILPTAATDLGGLGLFGAANAVTMIAYVVAVTLAGRLIDTRGPALVLRVGALAFLSAQILSALTPVMAGLVVGRLLSGLAEGLLDIGLTVLMARALPAELRPKAFALFAAAWVAPSLFGPPIAGLLAEWAGWRWAYVLPTAILLPAWVLLRGTLRAHGGLLPHSLERDTASLTPTGRAAGPDGSGAQDAPAEGPTRTPWRVVPPGTITLRRGLPATVALVGILAGSFGLASAFLPLMLSTVQGLRPAAAGLILSITGVFWAVGSQLNGLDAVQRRLSVAARARLGFALIATGSLGPAMVAVNLVPVWVGFATWCLAASGIGVCSPNLATNQLDLSPPAEQGRTSAAVAVASGATGALTVSAAGWLIAASTTYDAAGVQRVPGVTFAVICLAASALALGGMCAASRVTAG